jgi:hypothetical protein
MKNINFSQLVLKKVVWVCYYFYCYHDLTFFLGLFCYKFMSKYLEMKIFNYLKKIKTLKMVI